MPYTGYNGQEIEDSEGDAARQDLRDFREWVKTAPDMDLANTWLQLGDNPLRRSIIEKELDGRPGPPHQALRDPEEMLDIQAQEEAYEQDF